MNDKKHDYNITVKVTVYEAPGSHARPMGNKRCKRSNVSRCVIASPVNTYITIRRVRWLIKPSCGRLPSAHPAAKHQVGKCRPRVTPQLCRASKTVTWQIGLPTLRVVWQITQIRPYFKVIPGQVRLMTGSAIPGRNRVIAGYPSHL